MAQRATKYTGKSKKYKYVYEYVSSNGSITFEGRVVGYRKQGFLDDRKCALWVDKQLISKGKEPVNILVRK